MVEDEPEPSRRGELRVYLGAAPGVGKTCATLTEAHRRQARGTDVVVGVIETHGRVKTAELLEGLEVIPHGENGEIDVAAVLARRPEVAVVDDLAHANGPGACHERRHQDVEALLAAGITVLTTVNVQQLRSLTDVVERITGTVQEVTMPDEVVRRAEQVELVDITPEALRRRLAHGNVFPPERVDAELSNFFRTATLAALRELALLWVADQVDIALLRYRAEQDITDTWETRERVVVALTGGPESETLLRRSRRIAARAGAELLAVHVLRGRGPVDTAPTVTGRLRTIADEVGASFHTVVGDDVPTALLEFAGGANATQLVLGTSRRSRVARLFDEGIGATVVQRSGPIDVHMVTHDEAGGRVRAKFGRSPLAPSRSVLGWLLAVLLPAATTVAGVAWRTEIDFATIVVGFFMAAVVVAVVGGLGPAVVASIVSAGLLNFFFTAPYYTLVVSDARVVVSLVGMLIVSVVVALVIGMAARRAVLAARARTEASLLASYARTVLTDTAPLERLLDKVVENFGQSSATLLEKRNGQWRRVAHVGVEPGAAVETPDVEIPVSPDARLTLRGRALPAADHGVLEAAAGQALLALRQQRLAAATAAAKRKAEATELRTALLSAVGHDLRTPLTSIKASVSSLRAADLDLSPADTAELLETVDISTDRLVALVDNLLDSSRLATGTVSPHLHPVGYDEIVARALSTTDGSSAVVVDIRENLPWVLADAGLLERVVANVIDNALRHGAGTEPLAVRASTHGEHVELHVVDHGPGLPKGATESAFAPFQRLGDRDATPGIGLGLSVAKGFTEAMGGTVRAENTPGGGLTIVLSLPEEPGASR